jgi:AcrR family transcriptional regulator
MAEKAVDSRVRRTKRLLKQGLTELMTQKSIKKITVRELSELVDINRGTFYLHYKDIYDLVEQIENELFQEFESILMSYTIDDISRRPKQLLTDVCKFLDENRDICSALLGDNGDINFAQKLRGFIRKKCFNDISAAYNISDVSEFEFLYSYFESGFIGVARYWLQHPETGKSAEDIADIIERIFVFGVKDYIKGEKR